MSAQAGQSGSGSAVSVGTISDSLGVGSAGVEVSTEADGLSELEPSDADGSAGRVVAARRPRSSTPATGGPHRATSCPRLCSCASRTARHGRPPAGSVTPREHRPLPRLRRPPGRAADLRPPGRPGRQGARPRGGRCARSAASRGCSGMVAEVFGRRRIFVPMTRVTNIDSGQVYTTGLLNMRRFEQRPTETLVDRPDARPDGHASRASEITGTVYDVGMEQARNRDWVISRVARPGAGQGAAPPRPDPRRGVGRGRPG